jgi:hypothetical protein
MGNTNQINEAQAIAIARQIAEENNWAWVEPAAALWRPAWRGDGGKWEIFSNAQKRGAKVRVVIESPGGKILEKGYIPR